MKKKYVVAHSHWDREWYRPFQYFKLRLVYFFDELIEVLEKNANFKTFLLDGQMIMLEDYLSLKPQNKEKIKELVQRGKIVIGPFYTQPDLFTPSGESLYRNLLIGINQAKEFGSYMKIGYLPDAFGFSAQIPQILSDFDIQSSVVMRGVPVHKLNKTEFNWKGLDGTKILGIALPSGYSNGMFMPEEEKYIDQRIEKIVTDLEKYGNDEHFLILNGVDHQFVNEQMANYCENKEDIIHCSLQDYVDAVEKNMKELITLENELTTPVTNRVHSSIASTRIYQKTKNRALELELRSVESICSINNILGADYPQESLKENWKVLLQNQTHDGICGCCTDEIHKEIDQRFTDVENSISAIKKMQGRGLSYAIEHDNLVMTLYNESMTKELKRFVGEIITHETDIELVDSSGKTYKTNTIKCEKVDAKELSIWTLYLGKDEPMYKLTFDFYYQFNFNVGYETFYIKPSEKMSKSEIINTSISTNYLDVYVNKNGTLNVFDKSSNLLYENINTFEESGCAGDTYNYSPVLNDEFYYSKDYEAKKIQILEFEDYFKIDVNLSIEVPEKLVNQDQNRSTNKIELPIETSYIVNKKINRIDIKTKIVNQANDHRIRVLFSTPFKCSNSFSEIQFGELIRNNTFEDADGWEKYKWSEKPLPIYPMNKYVGLEENNMGVVILNKGLTEYEIYNDSIIAVTLLRGVSEMGKGNLLVRPGRPSGILLKTEDALCLGEHTYEYSFMPFTNSRKDTSAVAYSYATTESTFQNKVELNKIAEGNAEFFKRYEIKTLSSFVSNKVIQPEFSFNLVDIKQDELVISAFKKSEDGNGYILRMYNSTKHALKNSEIYFNKKIKSVYLTNALEDDVSSNKLINNHITLNDIKPFKIINLKVYL